MVYKLDVFISRNYVQKTFDSCKNVIMSSTNGPAMDFLCGPWGAYRCTAEHWFDYMGSTDNGFSPFDIIYRYMGNSSNIPAVDLNGEKAVDIVPLNPTAFHCSEIPPVSLIIFWCSL